MSWQMPNRVEDLQYTRNIGIVAHIDAGKDNNYRAYSFF
jgi:hypothetical protein